MAKQQAYLIIDAGTGNVRVAVVEANGSIISVCRAATQYHKDDTYPDALCFNPLQLWGQITALAAQALEQAENFTIIAITASSQREGIVLLDENGQALIGLPNVDHRGREWEDTIEGKNELYQTTGRYPGSLFSAMKLVGIRERRPELWASLSTFMSISDWVEYMFSSVPHYEHSQASETLLFDVKANKWSHELCHTFGIHPSMLPPLTASGTVLGMVNDEVAVRLNIDKAAKVIVGGADTQLAIMSTRAHVNDIVIVSGTTTPVIKLTGDYLTDSAMRTWTGRHTDRHSFMIEANCGVTGLNYQRLKEIFYPNEGYDVIEQELARSQDFCCVASLGSVLANEKTALTKGGFILNAPVSHLLTRADFVKSVLWDIACSVYENYLTLCEVTAYNQSYVWACGGGMQSRMLRQFMANLLNNEILIRSNYQQASVVGGAGICSSALNYPVFNESSVETVYPRENAKYMQFYHEWKAARKTFKSIS